MKHLLKRKTDEISFAEFKAWVDDIVEEGNMAVLIDPIVAASMIAIAVLSFESKWRRERIWREFNQKTGFAKKAMDAVADLKDKIRRARNDTDQANGGAG